MQTDKVFRIAWRIEGCEKWGWEVVIFDPVEEGDQLPLLPDDIASIGWETPSAARAAAVVALRELADRIERDEQ